MRVAVPILVVLHLVACAPAPDPGGPDAATGGPLGTGAHTTACARPGGLDRVTIEQRNFTTGGCALLVLVAPGSDVGFEHVDVVAPPDFRWGVESLLWGEGRCDTLIGSEQVVVRDATGRVTLELPDGGFFPTRVDVDLSATTLEHGTLRFEAEDVLVRESC